MNLISQTLSRQNKEYKGPEAGINLARKEVGEVVITLVGKSAAWEPDCLASNFSFPIFCLTLGKSLYPSLSQVSSSVKSVPLEPCLRWEFLGKYLLRECP